jgi:hypothetical protein
MSKTTKPATPAFIRMSFDKWVETFKPITNTATPDAPFDGCMFETFGSDLVDVLIYANGKHSHLRVWSLVEGDAGQYVVDGYHRVNRLGYFITAVPAVAGTQYEVAV